MDSRRHSPREKRAMTRTPLTETELLCLPEGTLVEVEWASNWILGTIKGGQVRDTHGALHSLEGKRVFLARRKT